MDIKMIINGTIVLEGGGSRGVFTAGVLDYLMENDVYLSNVIGVSVGACNAIDYVSKQIGRTKDCMIHEKNSPFKIRLKTFLKTGSFVDMNAIFDTYPNIIYPFDFETYAKSDMRCLIGVANCESGKSDYFEEKQDKARLLNICRASCSLPIITPIVQVDGKPYLDGGVSVSIPIEKALSLGEEKIVVVLTQKRGYRKSPSNKFENAIMASLCRKYPNLVESKKMRYLEYNNSLDYIEKLEDEGKIFVIRPRFSGVSRMENNVEKLNAFFDHGYQLMSDEYSNLKEYLSLS